MLVHHFITGNRPLATPHHLAETITLCVFGSLPDLFLTDAGKLGFTVKKIIKDGKEFLHCLDIIVPINLDPKQIVAC